MLGQVKRCRHWGLSAGKPCALLRRQCRVLLHQQLTNGWASEELQMPGPLPWCTTSRQYPICLPEVLQGWLMLGQLKQCQCLHDSACWPVCSLCRGMSCCL